MNFLINQTLQRKSLQSTRRVSSLAVQGTPSIISPIKDQTDSISFSPSNFINEYAKSRRCTARETKVLHTHLLKTHSLQSDIFVANSLLDCYCKSSSMSNALKLFDEIPQPIVISWNIMISGYNQNFSFEDSLKMFHRMHSSDFEPSENTYGSVLSACTSLQAIMLGQQVYSHAIKNAFISNGYVRTGMINLFSKSLDFFHALKVFHHIAFDKNIVCWNAIISGAIRNGENLIALDLFNQIGTRFFLTPNSFTFSSILTACATLEEIQIGKLVHGRVIKYGMEDVFVGTTLVDLYSKCGLMENAVNIFLRMPIRNVVSWTTIISGFVQVNDSTSALEFFKDMRKLGEEINIYTITSILNACAKPFMIQEAIQLHSLILKLGFYRDPVIRAALVNMYSKIGASDLSVKVFRGMDNTTVNVSLWASMIACFAQNREWVNAIKLFRTMLRESTILPDEFCTSSVLSAISCLVLGREIHSFTIKTGLISDVSVSSSLFTMYSKCGNLEDSHEVFNNMEEKDCVSWASMISGFGEHGFSDQAFKLFQQMLSEKTIPDQMILNSILSACSDFRCLRKGREIHGYAIRAGLGKDIIVGGALVSMYSKCGSLGLSRQVFEILPEKDHITWSSLISGYTQSKNIEQALHLFNNMLMAKLPIDHSFPISSIIGAIAILNRPIIGIQIHALIIKLQLEPDPSIGSSLVMMYSKTGSIEDCGKAFNLIKKPDLICWTSLIVSYAQHGKGLEALKAYQIMREKGIEPDQVTFIGLLSACSHSGLVEEGYYYLDSMKRDYGLEPGPRHYACMVDLLGRGGRLEEAERFISEMPMKADGMIWGTLLAACKVYGNIEVGKIAARKVMELEPRDAGSYVTVSNIWAGLGKWEEVLIVRDGMKGFGVKKEPGWSFL